MEVLEQTQPQQVTFYGLDRMGNLDEFDYYMAAALGGMLSVSDTAIDVREISDLEAQALANSACRIAINALQIRDKFLRQNNILTPEQASKIRAINQQQALQAAALAQHEAAQAPLTPADPNAPSASMVASGGENTAPVDPNAPAPPSTSTEPVGAVNTTATPGLESSTTTTEPVAPTAPVEAAAADL